MYLQITWAVRQVSIVDVRSFAFTIVGCIMHWHVQMNFACLKGRERIIVQGFEKCEIWPSWSVFELLPEVQYMYSLPLVRHKYSMFRIKFSKTL